MQSTLDEPGLHVAIIMDGNGRWATRRGLPRTAGHREGARALQSVLEAAPDLDIRLLTVFALSSDNLQRPRSEVQTLLRLLKRQLRSKMRSLLEHDVRISFIGRRDRLPAGLVQVMEQAEALTAGCRDWHLRVALDYSSRQAIAEAAERCCRAEGYSAEALSRQLAGPIDDCSPGVDLLIRTGGEQRLSDFLLWECAYAELYFTPTLWPDFDGEALAAAVEDYHRRDRRFGRVQDEGAAAGERLTVANAS